MIKNRLKKLEDKLRASNQGLWVIRPRGYYYGDLDNPFWTNDKPMSLAEHIQGKEYNKAEHPIHGFKVPLECL